MWTMSIIQVDWPLRLSIYFAYTIHNQPLQEFDENKIHESVIYLFNECPWLTEAIPFTA